MGAMDHEYDADKGIVLEKQKSSKYMTTAELAELPLMQRINWLSTVIIFVPLISFSIGVWFVKLRWQTFVLALVQYILTGIGITGGYHRLWSHKSYNAALPTQIVLGCWGAAAFEGSIRWWSRNHRAHHRYVDSDKDPYAVHKGFWYAHVGWMVLKQDSRRSGRVDITDLNEDKFVMWQHRHYLAIAITFAFIIPITIATLFWGDFWGALIYACMGRMFFVHQATFCVNSLAHTLGSQTYSTEHTSYDHIFTALMTFGEGYHNYHHEFPHDYRNGISWYHYDPTKWTVKLLNAAGLTSELVTFPENEIKKAKVQVKQAELDVEKKNVDWGKPISELPIVEWKDVADRTAAGELLIVLDGIVYKVWPSPGGMKETLKAASLKNGAGPELKLRGPSVLGRVQVDDFVRRHPGGEKVLRFWKGRDATRAFNGEIYNHSKAARNLLMHFRDARLQEKLE